MNVQEIKGKAQPPADREPIPAFSSLVEAKPTGIKQNPNKTKTTQPKRQQPKKAAKKHPPKKYQSGKNHQLDYNTHFFLNLP